MMFTIIIGRVFGKLEFLLHINAFLLRVIEKYYNLQEIVDIRKSLLPHLKAARKRGCTAKLVYDKLYIDGQLFQGNR